MCTTRRFLLLPGAVLYAAVAFGQGVDDPSKVFQLEGNVTREASICFQLTSGGAFTATPSGTSCPSGFTLVNFGANTDDWANFLTSGHASATSFISPSTSPAEAINSGVDSIFTGGGSKDVSGISSWSWKNGKPQGKDDIEHAFAAAYTLPGVVNGVATTCGGANQPACDIAVYFGMTRFDNSGDATAGFWFVQDGNIGLAGGTLNANNDPVCSVGSGCPFSGHHSNNDLLIVSDFSTGGPISTIQIFKWVCSGTGAACDSSGALVAQTSLATNECNPITHTSSFCAIANGTAGLSVPSSMSGFTNKSGQTTLDHGELLEGGVDLNVIFPNGIPCFSTFFAETRSSNSPTATLSDLTPPISFPLCGVSINKSCDSARFSNKPDSTIPNDPVTSGTTVQYFFSGTIKNTGIGPVTNVVVSDTPGGTFIAGTLVINQPDLSGTGEVLAAGASVGYSGYFQASSASNTQPNTATANATTTGGIAVSPASASWIVPPATVLPNSCSPAPGPLAIDKSCTVAVVPVGSVLEIRVDFSGTVTNNSGVQITNLSVTDDPATTITLGKTTLNNGESTTYSGSYFPSSCTVVSPGRCSFTDSVTASGTGAAGTGTIPSNRGGATCDLCPPGSAACPTAAQ